MSIRLEAFVVKRLRAAGAIILGKTNLTEMVTAAADSSLGGRTSNPWDLTRAAGQTSSGTGAAVAANFALLGMGTDNSQSIRSPASAGGLIGLKPTIGLVNCAGVLPSSLSHNSCGQIARAVSDLAHLLDVVAAFDPRDFMTRLALGQIPKTYASFLDADGLRGARLGVVVELLGDEPEHAEVNRLLVAFMDQHSLDALVYPLQKRLVSRHGEANADRNGFLASMGMLPAIDVPAGYSSALPTAPDGVPVGMDLLGRPFDEGLSSSSRTRGNKRG